MTQCFVTVSETLNPVVESQLLSPAAYHGQRAGRRIIWLALTPVGQVLRNPWRKRVAGLARRVEAQFGIEMRVAAIEPSRWKGGAMSRWWLDHHLRRFIATSKPDVLHARASVAAAAAIQARRRLGASCRIVFDCRGDEVAEAVAKTGNDLSSSDGWSPGIRAIYEDTFSRERRACEADSIIVVSKAMSRLLQERHCVPHGRIRVQPCRVNLDHFPQPQREAARERLGLTNELVIAYLGSAEWYQLPDESLRLFACLRASQPDAILLVITSHPARMRAAIAKSGITESACRLLSVERAEVPRLLAAADLGLLLRRADSVNLVASPVKFGEYLACGVPVAITPGVGDYSEVVVAERLGVCLSLDSEDSDFVASLGPLIDAARSGDRSYARRCREYARTHLSWQSLPLSEC